MLSVPEVRNHDLQNVPKKEQNCSLGEEQICSSACRSVPRYDRKLIFGMGIASVVRVDY